MLYGYDIGVIFGVILFMKKDLGLNVFMEGFVVSFLLVGVILGLGVVGKLIDCFGRKKVIMVVVLLFCIGGLGVVFVLNMGVMVLFCIILGFVVGILMMIVLFYLFEFVLKYKCGVLLFLN